MHGHALPCNMLLSPVLCSGSQMNSGLKIGVLRGGSQEALGWAMTPVTQLLIRAWRDLSIGFLENDSCSPTRATAIRC